jgi:ubiquinone biosynthesis protein UbiJ
MDTLETLFRPLTSLVNRQIRATTPARELCAELDGKVIAIRLKNTALSMYFCVCPDEIAVLGDFDAEPDVAISGSVFGLTRLAGDSSEDAIRDGSLELVGDSEVAQAFQRLLRFGRPDIEEELSNIIGDVAAHRLGEFARSVGNWGKEATATLQQNITEYLEKVDKLRDDVARLEARLNQLEMRD